MRVADAHGNPHAGGGSNPNLVDHGGPILPSAHLYAIWWGPASGWPSDTNSAMTSLLSNFGTSSYVQLGAQYMRGANLNVSYGGAYTDSSTPPAKLGTQGVASEIANVLKGALPDPNGIYIVFTSTMPRGGNFCAWHTGATVNGVTIAMAYIPNTTNIFGCGVPTNSNVTFTAGTQSIADSTAHEAMEAITDPQPAGTGLAWIDNGGQEIADKCETVYGNAVHIGGALWVLQEEWSNAISGCAQAS
jgi:hypothetical protein